MCGFCGYTGRVDEQLTKAMLLRIQHRGPDQESYLNDSSLGVSLGHARLSIVDIASGNQPMVSHDGRFTIAFNGEIYNHRKIRKDLELSGHKFKSDHSDTEVIIEGFRKYGEDIVQRLNGMWAFVILDREQNTLFFSRDRFGKKPLFYSVVDGNIIFGSELSAVIEHPQIKRQINPLAMAKYFAYGYVPSPISLIENVHKLDAGCNMLFSMQTGECSINRYWRYSVHADNSNSSEDWQRSIITELAAATKSRLEADVPVGVFLSGGIDSSSVINMAIGATQEPLNSFSVAFDDPSFDESAYSSDVAKIFGTEHHHSLLDSQSAQGLIGQITARLDEPIADSSLLPTYAVSQLASSKVKVVLGGDGADELFAGYDPFVALKYARLYKNLMPSPAHSVINHLVNLLPVSHSNVSLDFKLKRTSAGLSYPPSLWNPVWLGPMLVNDINRLFGFEFTVDEVYSESIDSWEYCDSASIYDKSMQFYIEQYMKNGILTKLDRASMMNGLEVRSPFLDRNFAELASKIPAKYKFHKGQTKHILKSALKPVLPLEVLYRKKKGFGVPVGQWFGNGSLQLNVHEQGSYCDNELLNNMIAEHKANKKDHRLALWALLMFGEWKQQWGASL